MNDLRYALRLLLKSPGFFFVAILTLALGIGANTAIFSVVNAVLLRPLPLLQPDRLVQLYETKKFPAGFLGSVSAANLRDWREQNRVFTGIAAFQNQDFALQEKASPQRLIGAQVSANYFRVLGVTPLLGRVFVEGEDQNAATPVAVISESFWRSHFNADPGVVRQTISLDGRATAIIGVMPARFRFPSVRTQVWAPLVISPEHLVARGDHDLRVIGRLRPDVSLAQADANMASVAQGIAQKFPDEQGNRGVLLVPLQKNLTQNSRASLLVLLGGVACVLLIASANLANLLLARTAGRQREVALRLALGASRARLVRQFLAESLLLASLGGIAGIIAAVWGIQLLIFSLGDLLPNPAEIGLDGHVLLFTAAIALLVGIACGLAPARQALGTSASDLQSALHGNAALAGATRLRSFFVVAEMALAVVLLAGAGLLLRSFAELQRADTGFRAPEQVLTGRVSLPNERYATDAAVVNFYQDALARVRNLPGVREVGAINFLPLAQWGLNGNVALEGHPFPPGQEPIAEFRSVGGAYFATLGVPLLAGRLLDSRDHAGAQPAALVNRAFARRFGESDAAILGNKIRIGGTLAFAIVGTVGDVRQSGLDRPAQPEIYFSLAQAPGGDGPGQNLAQSGSLVVRARAANPSSLADEMRRAIAKVDPGLPLFRVETLQNVIDDSIADRRTNRALLGSFAVVALGLAALGLFGVISYAVTQRTRELGIRVALGAQRGDVFRLIVGSGMKLTVLGLTIGLVAALGLTRLLASLLYGVSASDPVTFAGVAVLLGAVAFLANYFPARRAMKINPTIALRYE